MLRNLIVVFIFSIALGASLQAFGQDAPAPRRRVAARPAAPAPGATIERREEEATPQDANKTTVKPTPKPTPKKRTTPTGGTSAANQVAAAFDKLVAGIRASDVNAVMSVFWNSPQLTLFNYNGTVTRSWDQVRLNRSSSYPNAKDVSLDVKDVKVQMLGANAALVTCLWTQTQDYKGTPEAASGRLTLVFRQIGGAWKIIHTHTSPDAPDASRLPASEKTNATNSTVSPSSSPATKSDTTVKTPTTRPPHSSKPASKPNAP